MATWQFFDRYRLLGEANRRLRSASTIEQVLEVLRQQAREIAQADGVAVVQRLGDEVFYLGEDAIAPLWAGRRFPIRQCISGLAMLNREVIFIADILQDGRVPQHLYLATFVRSMAMYPLGSPEPMAALGLYWREPRTLSRDVDALMTMLAAGANAAFQSLALQTEQEAASHPTEVERRAAG